MAIETKLPVAAIAARVSEVVDELMEKGAHPADLTYALAAVATDMGLEIGEDPNKVVPILLSAIAHQMARRVRPKDAEQEPQIQVASDSTVH